MEVVLVISAFGDTKTSTQSRCRSSNKRVSPLRETSKPVTRSRPHPIDCLVKAQVLAAWLKSLQEICRRFAVRNTGALSCLVLQTYATFWLLRNMIRVSDEDWGIQEVQNEPGCFNITCCWLSTAVRWFIRFQLINATRKFNATTFLSMRFPIQVYNAGVIAADGPNRASARSWRPVLCSDRQSLCGPCPCKQRPWRACRT